MNNNTLKAEFRTEAFYQAYKPSVNLQDFIHEYWIMHLDKTAVHDKSELELPKLFPEIIFKYGEDYEELRINHDKKSIHKKSSLSGISSFAKASKRVNTKNTLLMVGIKFKPLGLFSILNYPVFELYDLCISLEDIKNNELIELEEKVYYAKNRIDILNLLNSQFENIIFKNNINSDSLKFTNLIENMNVNSLQFFLKNNQSNYKSLERKFKKIIGVNPKQYFKLKRFNSFYKDLLLLENTKYIDLVFKHNYYDQNHLIKDFKTILKTSPNKFLKNSNSHFTQHISKSQL